MSASLVGSEMCIRDRRPPREHRASAFRAEPAVGRPTTNVWHQTWVSTAPVSYTHLTLPTICSV
eukprot:6686500-Alexandrium_andersonii.AAC.1